MWAVAHTYTLTHRRVHPHNGNFLCLFDRNPALREEGEATVYARSFLGYSTVFTCSGGPEFLSLLAEVWPVPRASPAEGQRL